jgi:hypothetical protein
MKRIEGRVPIKYYGKFDYNVVDFLYKMCRELGIDDV